MSCELTRSQGRLDGACGGHGVVVVSFVCTGRGNHHYSKHVALCFTLRVRSSRIRRHFFGSSHFFTGKRALSTSEARLPGRCSAIRKRLL